MKKNTAKAGEFINALVEDYQEYFITMKKGDRSEYIIVNFEVKDGIVNYTVNLHNAKKQYDKDDSSN